jgi:zinc resistance-associated protein
MLKKAAVGAAALVIAGTMFVYAQQQAPGGPGLTAARDVPGMGGWRASPQDMSAFADARIAALHAGLQLNADQEKNWPAFEQALRAFSKMRVDRMAARQAQQQAQQSQPQGGQQQTKDPIDRLQRRAEAMTASGTALKQLADTAAPLYRSLDDGQKHRFTVLASVMRQHDGGNRMGHRRFGGGEEGGMRGEGFRHHREGGDSQNGGMRGGRGDSKDYRGPL